MFKITNLRNILLIAITTLSFNSCAQPKTDNKIKMKFEVNKTDAEWKQKLDSEQYYVLREKGTERPYTGKFLLTKDKGNYVCGACGNVLFSSNAKFDSHCGWPSFDKEIASGRILEQKDTTHGMERTEILCGKCGSHLGHVFNDGPTETGIRYCVNSLSLGFEKEGVAVLPKHETIVIGGGCYWCTEAIFQNLKGVESVESGFSGGAIKNPSYREVCTGQTGHAEVIKIVYNPAQVNLETILGVFFALHDPTTLNRQGADEGTQYRSAIFYANEQQKEIAEKTIEKLTSEHAYPNPIVTTLEPFKVFYKAEDYHQNYYNDNASQPYCQAVIKPKLDKFNKYFKNLKK